MAGKSPRILTCFLLCIVCLLANVLSPVIGFNNSGTGDTNPVDVPDRNPDFKGPVILGTVDHWFDPRAFKMPIAGTFGNVGRSSFRGPGLFDVDTSLFK